MQQKPKGGSFKFVTPAPIHKGQGKPKHTDKLCNLKYTERRNQGLTGLYGLLLLTLLIEEVKAKAKAYNTCRAPQAATATSEALVVSWQYKTVRIMFPFTSRQSPWLLTLSNKGEGMFGIQRGEGSHHFVTQTAVLYTVMQ